ncbi:unnamed protein product [marine sediment metagenome]|uniref:Uncharacterized protein n=1 Tax=marine sediment metagenome TaxID=412755 RepID=X0XN45_9ZZZZ
MAGNGYVYTVYKVSESAEVASEGFMINEVSTDGLLVVVDKCSAVEPTVTSAPSKPSYVTGMSNWPHLSHSEARQLIDYQATTGGGSNGWSNPSKE